MLTYLPTLDDQELAATRKDEAGFGALKTARGCLPLVALDVEAHIEGLIASTVVAQTFLNTFAEPLEATYIFPLPDRAAVSGFRLEVAGRVVEGELQERGAARREYTQALRAGHRAAIAEEERPGVFTVRVGNLMPGEEARVRLTIVGPLPLADGEVTFRFPLVVAPRYIPASAVIPDASRISPPVLLPGMPNPVQLRLEVHVVAPPLMEPVGFRASLHTVEEAVGPGHRFRLYPGERLDRDFVLRYRLAGDRVRSSLGDREFLAKRAYPFMKECALFYLDTLVRDPRTGLLVTQPSYSPENHFRAPDDGKNAQLDVGTTMSMAICRDIFRNCTPIR